MRVTREPVERAEIRRASGSGRPLLCALAVALSLAPAAGRAESRAELESRLLGMRAEIQRLGDELRDLGGREAGLLGELERLGAEQRLREAEHEEISLRLESVGRAIEEQGLTLAELRNAQADRERYLTFRLREIYKAGPEQALRRLIGDDAVAEYWNGLRYASYLSDRDARTMRVFREDDLRIERKTHELVETREELVALREQLGVALERLESSRRQRSRLLRSVREDRSQRRLALDELEQAAASLSRVVESLQEGTDRPSLDIRKFRGLLDWPADGPVTEGFGTTVHPRFQTRVPHPGLDIAGRSGDPVRSVFEGTVVFAAWMRGYGLTAIVDHGGGALSIYAHASMLLVEPGQRVTQGQRLGNLGETGSLKGPHLYFELRTDGKPVDPVLWLRRR